MDFKLLNTRITISLELEGSRNSALQLSICVRFSYKLLHCSAVKGRGEWNGSKKATSRCVAVLHRKCPGMPIPTMSISTRLPTSMATAHNVIGIPRRLAITCCNSELLGSSYSTEFPVNPEGPNNSAIKSTAFVAEMFDANRSSSPNTTFGSMDGSAKCPINAKASSRGTISPRVLNSSVKRSKCTAEL